MPGYQKVEKRERTGDDSADEHVLEKRQTLRGGVALRLPVVTPPLDDPAVTQTLDQMPLGLPQPSLFSRLRPGYTEPAFTPTAPTPIMHPPTGRKRTPTSSVNIGSPQSTGRRQLGRAPEGQIKPIPESRRAKEPRKVPEARKALKTGPAKAKPPRSTSVELPRYDSELDPRFKYPRGDAMKSFQGVYGDYETRQDPETLGVTPEVTQAFDSDFPMSGFTTSGYFDKDSEMDAPPMSRAGQRSSQLLSQMSRVAYVDTMKRQPKPAPKSKKAKKGEDEDVTAKPKYEDPVEVQHGFVLDDSDNLELAASSNSNADTLLQSLGDRTALLSSVLDMDPSELGPGKKQLVKQARRSAGRIARFDERLERQRQSGREDPADLDLAMKLHEKWMGGDFEVVQGTGRHAEQNINHRFGQMHATTPPDQVLTHTGGTKCRCFACTSELGTAHREAPRDGESGPGVGRSGRGWTAEVHPQLAARQAQEIRGGRAGFLSNTNLEDSSESESEIGDKVD